MLFNFRLHYLVQKVTLKVNFNIFSVVYVIQFFLKIRKYMELGSTCATRPFYLETLIFFTLIGDYVFDWSILGL